MLYDLQSILGMRKHITQLKDLRQDMINLVVLLHDLVEVPKIREYRFELNAFDDRDVDACEILETITLDF